MKGKKISKKERLCISECINKYWGHPNVNTADHDRDMEYEECLTSCVICG